MAKQVPGKVTMEKLVSLCQRRGFIFPSSEIYGGLSSCWDYGPVGVELKRNIKEAWWRSVVQERDDMVGLDTSILMNPRVWEASGHLTQFADPLVECKNCHQRWRADDLQENKCPACGGELTEPQQFNLMFRTFMGPVEEAANVVYLRPETAQGIFVNFQNAVNTSRKRLPFGIAQIGKAFRNEITTGNFIFRSREFEQMEIEYFVKPGTDDEWFDYWLEERLNWYVKLGIKRENLRQREHSEEELAHYARKCYDIDYNFPMGWSELEGIANRTDFDLKQHMTYTGKSLTYLDEEILFSELVGLIAHRQVSAISPTSSENKITFRWTYIVLPLAILLLSVILTASFYGLLPDEVAYRFEDGAADGWMSRGAIVAWLLIPQLFLVLVGIIMSGGTTILSKRLQAENTSISKILSIMGNMVALPQIILAFAMLDIFLYNAYQIHLFPLWIFALIIIVLGSLVLSIFLIQALRQLRSPSGRSHQE